MSGKAKYRKTFLCEQAPKNMSSNQAGKGDMKRPVKGETFRANFDDIFRKESLTMQQLYDYYDDAVIERNWSDANHYDQRIKNLAAKTPISEIINRKSKLNENAIPETERLS